jgi:NADH-quinone oxidoreductase subunit H
LAAYLTLIERKLIGRIQLRKGPNKCGICGLFQPIADALKLFFKRTPFKNHSRQAVFGVCLLFTVSLVQLTLIPTTNGITILNPQHGLLFIILLHSIIVFSEILIGASSKSKYGVIGGTRAYIQTLGSHIPLILFFLAIMLFTKTSNLNKISEFISNSNLIIVIIPFFIMFFIISLISANRTPFDFPEAESELVGGAYTEYGGILFAMIYISDYLNLLFISGLNATLFLVGYRLPFVSEITSIILKTLVLASITILIRAILPRYRQDQMINISWSVITPIILIIIFILY